jgi:hypothetical protein
VPARDKKVVQRAVTKGQTVMWSCCPESMDVGLEIKFVAAGGATDMLFNEAERVSTLKRGECAHARMCCTHIRTCARARAHTHVYAPL